MSHTTSPALPWTASLTEQSTWSICDNCLSAAPSALCLQTRHVDGRTFPFVAMFAWACPMSSLTSPGLSSPVCIFLTSSVASGRRSSPLTLRSPVPARRADEGGDEGRDGSSHAGEGNSVEDDHPRRIERSQRLAPYRSIAHRSWPRGRSTAGIP